MAHDLKYFEAKEFRCMEREKGHCHHDRYLTLAMKPQSEYP